VSSTSDAIAVIAEILTWVCLLSGPIFLVIGFGIGMAAHRWDKTSVLLLEPGTHNPVIRWMTTNGELHERELLTTDLPSATHPDDLTLYYNRGDPERVRFDSPVHDGRPLRLTGWILISVGIIAVVTQLIILFVE
jgi:hypothetical protein